MDGKHQRVIISLFWLIFVGGAAYTSYKQGEFLISFIISIGLIVGLVLFAIIKETPIDLAEKKEKNPY
jgi:hypothetical protein